MPLTKTRTATIARATGKRIGTAASDLKDDATVFAKRLAAKAGRYAKLRDAKTVQLKDVELAAVDLCARPGGPVPVSYPRAPLVRIMHNESGLRVSKAAADEFVQLVSGHAADVSVHASAIAEASKRKTVKPRDVSAVKGIVKKAPSRKAISALRSAAKAREMF